MHAQIAPLVPIVSKELIILFLIPTARKQDDFGANVELIGLLSNFYLLAHVGDKPTLQALHFDCPTTNK